VDIVGDAVSVGQLVKLLVVHAMGSFDLAVQVRRPRTDVDMADVQGFEVPVKLRLNSELSVWTMCTRERVRSLS
jgi:hypothetical protein